MNNQNKKMEQPKSETTTLLNCRCCKSLDGIKVLLESYFSCKNKTYRVDDMYKNCINSKVRMEGYPKYICVNCLQELINAHEFKIKCLQSNAWFEKNKRKKITNQKLFNSTIVKKDVVAKEVVAEEVVATDIDSILKKYKQSVSDSKNECENVTNDIFMDHNYIKFDETEMTQNQNRDSDSNAVVENSISVKKKNVRKEKLKREKIEFETAELISNSFLENPENGIMNFETISDLEPAKKTEIVTTEILNLNNFCQVIVEENLTNLDPDFKIDQKTDTEVQNENVPKNMEIHPQNENILSTNLASNIEKENSEKSLDDAKKMKVSGPKQEPKFGKKDIDGKYTCKICGTKVVGIRKHMDLHEKERTHMCTICGRAFLRRYSLKHHLLIHAGIRNFACGKCDKKFVTKVGMQNHQRFHSEVKPHLCSYCGKSFTLRVNLVDHIRTHTGEKHLKCKYEGCDRRFASYTGLKLHLLSHSGEKPQLCQYCGKGFKIKSELTLHVKTHTGEKPYKCTYCDRKFKTNAIRILHTRAAHTGERPYTCDICKKSFYAKGKLRDHKKIHSKELKYGCEICDEKFPTKGKLKVHLGTHNDYKNYECQYCQEKFAKKRELREHYENIHPEKIPTKKYTCKVCATEFENISILNEHTKLHEKQDFVCNYCYKIFTNAGGLARHIARLHSEEVDFSESNSTENDSMNSESDSDSS